MSSNLDFVDFRLFMNIAEANSVTAGAEKSNLSTSAASLRIRNLEESLQGKLLHRTSHGVTLTPAGEAFLHRVRVILQEFDNLQHDLRGYSDDQGQRLRIAVSDSGVNEPLPSIMHRYMTLCPTIKLALHVRMSNEIEPAVSEGVVDIGIGSARAKAVDTVPYLRDRLALIVPSQHPLAQQVCVRFADALDYDIIGLPERSGAQIFMRRIAQNSRKPMKSSVTVSSNDALRQMVEAGIGIGVISERTASAQVKTAAVKLIRLKDKSAARDINIQVVSLRDMPPHVKRFVDLLRNAAVHEAGDDPREEV